MKTKLIFIGLFTLLLILNHLWAEKSCSYCFQSFLAENYIFEDKAINFNSEYVDNTINLVRHNSTNLVGRFVGGVLKDRYLNFLFWIFIATLASLLFYRKIFDLETGMFAAFIYLTNPTLPVTIHTIPYYFLALFFIYNFFRSGRFLFLLLFLLTLIVSFNVDISPSFVILITSLFLILFYFLMNKKIDKKILFSFALLITIFLLVVIFEKNFVSDLLSRVPAFFDKFMFYFSSYPKGVYFYLFILSKILLIILPGIYFFRTLSNQKFTRKESFIFSYLLTIFPLMVLFVLFDISARVFDYYLPLFAAISFRESRNLFGKKTRKVLIIVVSLFLIFFSIFLHYIPPRSLETYSADFLEGLSVIPKDAVVYTDVFVANALITKLDHTKVIGADFNRGDEYLKVYYEKDKEYMKNLFEKKNVKYFIISRQSLIRGLEVLNGPHILKPISIKEYDNIEFLERHYKNEEIYIWKVLK